MYRKLLPLLLILMVVVTACQEPEPESPPPDEIVNLAAERMSEMKGFKFAMAVSDEPAFLDENKTLSLGSGEGFYMAPDKAVTSVTILTPGLVTEVSIISIGDEQWLAGLVTDEWSELPTSWGFNPAFLVNSEQGILSTLATDLSGLQLAGREKLPGSAGEELFKITGMMDGGRIFELSQGLIGPEAMEVTLWIGPETYELHRVVVKDFSEEASEEPTTWQIDFTDFDKTIEITPPTSS